jgi:hypothetical protein
MRAAGVLLFLKIFFAPFFNFFRTHRARRIHAIVEKIIVSALKTLVTLFGRLELGRSILVSSLAPEEKRFMKIFDELDKSRVELGVPLLNDVHGMDCRAFDER